MNEVFDTTMNKQLNPTWVTATIGLIALISASFASYYNALADIKSLLTDAFANDRLINEQKYVQKAELGYIKDMILEVRSDVKDIKKEITHENK